MELTKYVTNGHNVKNASEWIRYAMVSFREIMIDGALEHHFGLKKKKYLKMP